MGDLASMMGGGTIPCNWVKKPLKHFTASPTKKMFQIYKKPQKPYSSIISYTRPPHSLDNGGGKRCTYQFSCIPCSTTLNNEYNIAPWTLSCGCKP
jgi:hypothetical protein